MIEFTSGACLPFLGTATRRGWLPGPCATGFREHNSISPRSFLGVAIDDETDSPAIGNARLYEAFEIAVAKRSSISPRQNLNRAGRRKDANGPASADNIPPTRLGRIARRFGGVHGRWNRPAMAFDLPCKR